MAIHTHPVIARSAATWQSIFQAVPDARWIASPLARNDGGAARNDGRVLAMTVGTRNDPNSCHCEERSDVAIHPHSCHCEERRDVAIYVSGGAERKMDCFAFGSQ